jgi:hypothetical protein
MNGKFTTSCLLFLLSDWAAHAAESNLRGGGSRSLAPEPELFGLVGGGESSSLTTFPTFTTATLSSPFQFPTGGVTATFPSVPVVPSTLPFQFPTDVFTAPFPSIPTVPFQLDPTNMFQHGSPHFDYGNMIGGLGLGLGGPLVGGRSCPNVPDGIPCTANYLPLSCDGCVYDNSCLAKAAGFSEGQCQQVRGGSCPTGPGGAPCPLNYAPVSCDGCEYANSCSAEAAGFPEGQCEPAPF